MHSLPKTKYIYYYCILTSLGIKFLVDFKVISNLEQTWTKNENNHILTPAFLTRIQSKLVTNTYSGKIQSFFKFTCKKFNLKVFPERY